MMEHSGEMGVGTNAGYICTSSRCCSLRREEWVGMRVLGRARGLGGKVAPYVPAREAKRMREVVVHSAGAVPSSGDSHRGRSSRRRPQKHGEVDGLPSVRGGSKSRQGSNRHGGEDTAAAAAVATVESAMLLMAVATHVAHSWRRGGAEDGGERTQSRKHTRAVAGEKAAQAPADTTSTVWLTGPILLALVSRKVGVWWSKGGGMQRQGSPTAQAMLRLRNVEIAQKSQEDVIASLSRNVDKLQVRTRLVSKDVRDALRDVEEGTALTGDVVQDTAARMELMNARLDELESLVGSVHDVAAKQFELIAEIVTQQKQLVQQQKAASSPREANRLSSSRKAQPGSTNSPNAHATVQVRGKNDGNLDEWGRVSVMQNDSGKQDPTHKIDVEEAPSLPNGKASSSSSIAQTRSAHRQRDMNGISVEIEEKNDGTVSYSF